MIPDLKAIARLSPDEFLTFMANMTPDDMRAFLPAADPVTRLSLLTTLLMNGEPRSPKWPGARAAWLRNHPACAACGTRDFLQVHHKVPFHVDPGKELDPSNFITLCETPHRNCHLTMGHCGNFALFNDRVEHFTEEFFKQWQAARGIL